MSGFISGGSPKTSDGTPIIAQSPYAYTEINPRFIGELYTCTPGTSVHEKMIDSAVRLQGLCYWVKNPNLGDKFSLSIIDKNDVLGRGADSIVGEYVEDLYLAPWDHLHEITTSAVLIIPAGVCVKITYENTGSQNVTMGVTYRWFQQ